MENDTVQYVEVPFPEGLSESEVAQMMGRDTLGQMVGEVIEKLREMETNEDIEVNGSTEIAIHPPAEDRPIEVLGNEMDVEDAAKAMVEAIAATYIQAQTEVGEDGLH